MKHPTKVGQIVKFLPDRNNEDCNPNSLFKVIDFWYDEEEDESYVKISPLTPNPDISPRPNRYASRFVVVSPRISYTKDIHGTIHNRPKPNPIQRNEDNRTQFRVPPRRISMDSFTDGNCLCESATPRQPSSSTSSVATRLRETLSQGRGLTIRENFFQWSRGLIGDARNGRIEIPRPNHAAEARRLEGNQSARYQRNSTSRHSVSTDVQESRPARSSVLWGEGSTFGLSGTSLYNSCLDFDSYSDAVSRIAMQREVYLRQFISYSAF